MFDFLKEPGENPGRYFSLVDNGMQGTISIASLHAGVFLKLFDHLESSQATSGELADRTGIDERTLLPLLRVLGSIGVISEEQGCFKNTRIASVYLVSDSPYCQKSHLEKNVVFFRNLWACLPERLAGNPMVFSHQEFFSNLALPAMAENALTGRLQRTVREIAALPEFASAKKMIDLGGGHGLYAIALTSLNSRMDAFVFDLPHIIPLAERSIRKWNASRVFTIPGDFFTDEIGSGYDLVLSSSNPSGKNPRILPKLSRAMNAGGLFVNIQTDPGDRDDPYHALEWQLWTLDREGKGEGTYTREAPFMTDEYRIALEEASLQIIFEKKIRDDYHKESSVHMVVMRKEMR